MMKKNSVRETPAVIIMAGGMGTRFWPSSRERVPKQFLPICGPRPLVEECFLRIAPLTDPSKTFVVTNVQHRSLTERVLGDWAVQVVEEPCGRNTLPCIGLGCIHILKRFGDLPVIALPADHYVSDETEFQGCLRRGLSLLNRDGIVTLGITPTHPETGYGYIEKGRGLGHGGAFVVDRFVEKPDLERAITFLASQNYLWNAGIFLFRPSTMLRQISLHCPGIGKGLDRIGGAIDTDHYDSTLEEVYGEMESISIDHGVMEKTREPIYVIQGNFGWSDVGSWASARELRGNERDGKGNVVSGKALLLDTTNTLIHSQSNRLIAVLGVDNLLVVDTEDVLLVGDMNRSQDLRRFPESLRQKGWTEYI